MDRPAGSPFIFRFIEWLAPGACALGLILALVCLPIQAQERPGATPPSGKADSSGEKYRWLFGDQPEPTAALASHHPGLKALDREIKRAASSLHFRGRGRSTQVLQQCPRIP